MSLINLRIVLILVFFCIGLSACSPPKKVAVVERATVSRAIEIDRLGGNLIRHVQPGDTLYSISFAMGLDVNDVASWNGITDTAKLQMGQMIRLTKPIGFVKKPIEIIKPEESIVVGTIPNQNSANRPSVNTDSNQSISSVQKPEQKTPISLWNWPLDGRVIREFSQAEGQQGIDIQGNAGQAVWSTTVGEVVYVGNGLKGYGNLVIIKHSETFLSAYAHNSEIYVREGEQVSAQQRIASLGINRNKQTALHFQIRKNGQPVNPLSYLSKKA